MFEEYAVSAETVENIRENGTVTGFRMAIRPAMDRGIWLSLVAGFYLSIDGGSPLPREAFTLAVNGQPPRTLEQLKQCSQERWRQSDPAWLYVALPGGLTPGKHSLTFQEQIFSGYFKARAEWVENPPAPGSSGQKHTFFCHIGEVTE